jgi:topoisomerase IV subunit A
VLSERGWARAGKGHDLDPATLQYKAGDSFKMAARGKSSQNAIFIDSTGRSYSLPSHSLASARGQGEPLSGRLAPPAGATFEGVLLADDRHQVLLASDGGYGFVTSVADLQSKNKAGKAMLKLSKGSRVLPPLLINNYETDTLVAVTNEGRMLSFPLTELPILPRGKGNKIISIPSARVNDRLEFLVALTVVHSGGSINIHAGRRHLVMKASDLAHYTGERGRRGNKLPRGFQNVDRIELVHD